MRYARKTTPRVVDGKVQRKNRVREEPDYRPTHQIRIERRKPVPGFRHYVSPADVTAFLGLLPEWPELAIGLQCVLLDDDTSCFGWQSPGTVAICAWEEICAGLFDTEFIEEHSATLDRIGVPCARITLVGESCSSCRDKSGKKTSKRAKATICVNCCAERYELELADTQLAYDDARSWDKQAVEEHGAEMYVAQFTESSVRAFQLIHVLVHELGHHHDHMTSPKRRGATRGESYAEEYALRHEKRIWSAYCRVFQPH